MSTRSVVWWVKRSALLCAMAGLSVGCDDPPVPEPNWNFGGGGGTSSAGGGGADSTTSSSSSTSTSTGTGGTGGVGGQSTGGTGGMAQAVPDFSLMDVNPNSLTNGQPVSPRDYLMRVSAWYFGHST